MVVYGGAAMSERDRVCQRAGCRQSAAVTLSFRYDARQASLTDLSGEKHPACYDLCDGHADHLVVPRGWERLDRRTPGTTAPPSDVDDVVGSPADDAQTDRYAVLKAQLPRLAERLGFVAADAASDAHQVAARGVRPGRAVRDLADPPVTVGTDGPWTEQPRDALHEAPPVPATPSLLAEDVLEGQLQMPIESERHGVVVALSRVRSS